MRHDKPGFFSTLPCAQWQGEWAWGNYPSEETAHRDCLAVAAMGRHYSRILIDPASRTEPPPGRWCIIWRVIDE